MELKIDNKAVEELVRKHLQVEVAKALSSKSDYLIESLVSAAINTKKDSWGRETVLEGTINTMILEEANKAVAEWLNEQRPKIFGMVRQKLNGKTAGLIKQIVDQLSSRMCMKPQVQVWFEGKD